MVETKLCTHAMTYKSKATIFDEERLRELFETRESAPLRKVEEDLKMAVFFLSGTEDDVSLICTKAETLLVRPLWLRTNIHWVNILFLFPTDNSRGFQSIFRFIWYLFAVGGIKRC